MSDFKVLFAEIENFKGIRHRVITFDGRSAYLIGGNGKGKSSVIDALLSPIDSSFVPTQPINKDAEENRGIIRLQVGNGETTYEINAVYTPSARTGTITLFENGAQVKTKVKTKLHQIFGDISFDMYAWLNKSMDEKIKDIKKLTGVEPQLNEIAADRKVLEEERKLINRDIETMSTVNDKDNRPFTPEDIRKYENEPETMDAINAEIAALQPEIDTWNRVTNGISDSLKKIERLENAEVTRLVIAKSNAEKEVEAATEALRLAKKRLEDANQKRMQCDVDIDNNANEIQQEKDKVVSGNTWLAQTPNPNTKLADINTRIGELTEYIRMHGIIKVYKQRQKDVFTKKEELGVVEGKIKALDEKKIQLISSSQLPIEGLTFTDDMIYLNGLPLEEGQVNTATIRDVAVKIAKSNNKKLKLVVIREASLFDKTHLIQTIQDLEKDGYQWVAEIVDPEGADLTIQFAEHDLTPAQ